MPPRPATSQRSSPLIKAGDSSERPVAALTKLELQQQQQQHASSQRKESETARQPPDVRNENPANTSSWANGASNNNNLLMGPLSSSALYNPSSNLGVGAGYGNLGLGSFGSAGMLGSPYGYGGMMMPAGGPFSGLNQFLFGVQNVIFSLSQAVQIVGMNTQALHHLLESATAMFDHAVATWHEMRVLEATSRRHETEEMKKRRRRLRAVRWAVVTAVVYAGYKLIRRVIRQRNSGRLLEYQQTRQMYAPHQTYAPGPYYSSSNQYSQTGMPHTGYGDPQLQTPYFYGGNLSGPY